MNEEYVDLDTVAKQLGCHKLTLLQAVRNQKLTAITGVWKGYRTTWQWVQEYLNGQTIHAQEVRAGGK